MFLLAQIYVMLTPLILFKHIGWAATKQRNNYNMISDACCLSVMLKQGRSIRWCQSPSKTFDHQMLIKTFEPHLLPVPKEPKKSSKSGKPGRKPSAESNLGATHRAVIKELNSTLPFSSGFFSELMLTLNLPDWKEKDILFLELDGSLSSVLGFCLKTGFRYLNICQTDDSNRKLLFYFYCQIKINYFFCNSGFGKFAKPFYSAEESEANAKIFCNLYTEHPVFKPKPPPTPVAPTPPSSTLTSTQKELLETLLSKFSARELQNMLKK